jgi:hypothetical protein
MAVVQQHVRSRSTSYNSIFVIVDRDLTSQRRVGSQARERGSPNATQPYTRSSAVKGAYSRPIECQREDRALDPYLVPLSV